MSSPEGFRRCDGYVGSVPQNFINSNMPVCPMCGSHDPYWTLKDKIEFTANRIQFRCKDCGCVLSATNMDFTGKTKSTAFAMMTTAGSVNYLVKKKQGKDVKTVYMRVDDTGTFRTDNSMLGKEFALEEMQAMAAALDAPVQQAPTPPAAEPAPSSDGAIHMSFQPEEEAKQEEPTFKVSYDTKAEEPQPAAGGFNVSYDQSAPTIDYSAPKQAAPVRRPVGALVFSILTLCSYFFALLVTGVILRNRSVSITPMQIVGIASMILMIVGAANFRKPVIFGISLFLHAIPLFTGLSLPGLPRIFYYVFGILAAAGLILAGLHYVLKGRGITRALKNVGIGIFAALNAISLIVILVYQVQYIFPVYGIMSFILYTVVLVMKSLAVFKFNVKAEEA